MYFEFYFHVYVVVGFLIFMYYQIYILKLSLTKELTLCFIYSFPLKLHFLFFVFNIYLYIDLYTDIPINIPPWYSKIKHFYNNIIKRKTSLTFRYMFFYSNHVIMISHQLVLKMLSRLEFFKIFITDLEHFVIFTTNFGY